MGRQASNPGISRENELEEYVELVKVKPKKHRKYQALLYDWEVEAVQRIQEAIAPDDKEARAVFARFLHYANEALFQKNS